MKRSLLLVLTLFATAAHAQTITSVANGNFSNPAVWDCSCVPMSGNTIIINHLVELDMNFETNGSVTINSTGRLQASTLDYDLGLTGGSLLNEGTLKADSIYHTGGTFTNNKSCVAGALTISGPVTFTNTFQLNTTDLYVLSNATLINTDHIVSLNSLCTGTINNNMFLGSVYINNTGTVNNNAGAAFEVTDFTNSGDFNNHGVGLIYHDLVNSQNILNTNQVTVYNSLYNHDPVSLNANLTNNGLITVLENLHNGGILAGNGNFCVQDTTSNSGSVNGTLFFCDQSGNFFDENTGFVELTVTFCTGGSCLTGINDQGEIAVNIYPNPVSSYLNIEMNVYETYEVSVHNNLGEKVLSGHFTGSRHVMDLTALQAGIYFYRIGSKGQTAAGTFIKQP